MRDHARVARQQLQLRTAMTLWRRLRQMASTTVTHFRAVLWADQQQVPVSRLCSPAADVRKVHPHREVSARSRCRGQRTQPGRLAWGQALCQGVCLCAWDVPAGLQVGACATEAKAGRDQGETTTPPHHPRAYRLGALQLSQDLQLIPRHRQSGYEQQQPMQYLQRGQLRRAASHQRLLERLRTIRTVLARRLRVHLLQRQLEVSAGMRMRHLHSFAGVATTTWHWRAPNGLRVHHEQPEFPRPSHGRELDTNLVPRSCAGRLEHLQGLLVLPLLTRS